MYMRNSWYAFWSSHWFINNPKFICILYTSKFICSISWMLNLYMNFSLQYLLGNEANWSREIVKCVQESHICCYQTSCIELGLELFFLGGGVTFHSRIRTKFCENFPAGIAPCKCTRMLVVFPRCVQNFCHSRKPHI